jgi:membrane associated rhomboid family serine protease
MIGDRDYMRDEPAYRGRWSLSVWLVIVNVAAYLLQQLSYLAFPPAAIGAIPHTDALFALSLDGLKQGFVWQLLTFQLMHGGLLHLLLNCFAIFMFGRAVEEALGRRGFITLYLAGGVVGGLFQVLGALVSERFFGGEVVGASAGAFALIAAFAVLYPERPLTLLLFFVVPINMRAKYLLIGSGLLAVLGMLVPGSGVAHAAHLGGMLAGVAFVRWAGEWNWPRLRLPVRQRARPVLVSSGARKASAYPPPRDDSADELPAAEFISKEVDPILDKISAHGIHSLTDRERKTLEAARKKMAKR